MGAWMAGILDYIIVFLFFFGKCWQKWNTLSREMHCSKSIDFIWSSEMHLHCGITSYKYSSKSNITFIPQVVWNYSGFPAYGHLRSLWSIPVETTSYKCKGSSWMGNLNWLQLVPGVVPTVTGFMWKLWKSNRKHLKWTWNCFEIVKASCFTLI